MRCSYAKCKQTLKKISGKIFFLILTSKRKFRCWYLLIYAENQKRVAPNLLLTPFNSFMKNHLKNLWIEFIVDNCFNFIFEYRDIDIFD